MKFELAQSIEEQWNKAHMESATACKVCEGYYQVQIEACNDIILPRQFDFETLKSVIEIANRNGLSFYVDNANGSLTIYME